HAEPPDGLVHGRSHRAREHADLRPRQRSRRTRRCVPQPDWQRRALARPKLYCRRLHDRGRRWRRQPAGDRHQRIRDRRSRPDSSAVSSHLGAGARRLSADRRFPAEPRPGLFRIRKNPGARLDRAVPAMAPGRTFRNAQPQPRLNPMKLRQPQAREHRSGGTGVPPVKTSRRAPSILLHGRSAHAALHRVEIIAVAIVAILFIIVFPALNAAGVVSNFTLNLWGKYLCYALLAISVDLLWGYTGLLSLGQ